ncbi:DUF1489 family protein [Sphingopyxis microcysteis]|uniref:DUF1489 family protein n=1 Tax=Sphingopyxis microcysteis TaxID=2484145 RepID=UPI001446AC9F|nr:DUF1489 family protein [Sphingopyxis microcysteis]
MALLHLTKVAVGCAQVETFARRVAARASEGELRVPTRMRPKRMDELVGGYLHWIIKHRIVARQRILRFDDRKDGRVDIVCSDDLEILPPLPKRAHQGWRYLADEDAPRGMADRDGAADLPTHLYRELAALMLI